MLTLIFKKAQVSIFTSNRVDFKERKVTRDKAKTYIMIKGSILHENITILNVDVPNNRSSSYVRQNLLELRGETEKSTIITEDFNTLLSENPAS